MDKELTDKIELEQPKHRMTAGELYLLNQMGVTKGFGGSSHNALKYKIK